MVLAAYGKRISEKRLRKLCNCQPGLGTRCSDVVNAARSLGFTQSVETYQLRLHDLRDLVRSGVFPIVGVNLYELRGIWSPHAQVVANVTARSVEVCDPLLGRLWLMARTFERAWEIEDFPTILVQR
jgi:ABC-type bacteriocin/lantibiotic exporter with double-glycine peptidase domain